MHTIQSINQLYKETIKDPRRANKKPSDVLKAKMLIESGLTKEKALNDLKTAESNLGLYQKEIDKAPKDRSGKIHPQLKVNLRKKYKYEAVNSQISILHIILYTNN